MRVKSKTYQRATIRKIVKAHARKHVGRAIDPLIVIGYILFMEELMSRATRKARADGEKSIASKDIRKVTMLYEDSKDEMPAQALANTNL